MTTAVANFKSLSTKLRRTPSCTQTASNPGVRGDEAVVCEITDEGRITDPLAGRRRVGPEQASGRGLLLAAMMSDLLQIVVGETGNIIRIHKNIT